MNITPLYQRAVAHYIRFHEEPYVVKPSIPILYFGDVHAFQKSNLKIVTVGLNPSHIEFGHDRFRVTDAASLPAFADLEEDLCNYFKIRPYTAWFNRSFEALLQALGSSFYGGRYPALRAPPWWAPQRNTALHTDIGTPIATNPTWSKLPPVVTTQLRSEGFELWRDLIIELEPHIILISVAKQNLSLLGKLNWRGFSPFPESEIRHELQIADFGKAKIVWGQSQVLPFFHLKQAHMKEAARAILDEANIPA